MLTTRNREVFLLTQAHSRRAKSVQPQSVHGMSTTIPPDGGTCRDPFHDLRLKLEDARHVTEIHFGKKNIKTIHPSFQHFVNLESLWLNDNQLESAKGLFPDDSHDTKSGCMRLRKLYLSNNGIATLGNDLQRLRFLEVLLLSGNKLSNMEAVALRLKPLRYLKQLDLFGNPLAEEKNYRQYFIVNLPSLEILDRHVISDRERAEAPAFFAAKEDREAPKINRRVFKKLSPSVELLEKSVKAIHTREKIETERAATEEERSFRERYDRRAAFHAKWPGKPWVPSEGHRDMSAMFVGGGNKAVADNLEFLIPERSDTLAPIPTRPTQDVLEERFFPMCVTPVEFDSLKNTLGTNTVLLEDAPNILKLLHVPSLDVIDLNLYVGNILGKDKASVELRTMLSCLLRYQPFVAARMAQLHQLSREAMGEGNADGAMAFLRRANALQEIAVTFVSESKPHVGNYFGKKK